MKKLDSFTSKRLTLDISSIKGGISLAAAARRNKREWITRTNVSHGPASLYGQPDGTPANMHLGDYDPFGDISLDTN